MITPICAIGTLELRDCIVDNSILEYYGITKFYINLEFEYVSKAPIYWINNLIYSHTFDIIYGIQIDIISISQGDEDSIFSKVLAEKQLNNFIKFMYEHYKLEYEMPIERICMSIPEKSVKNVKRDINYNVTPDCINNIECNVYIYLHPISDENEGYNESKEINKEFNLYIAKAGFKMNTNSISSDDYKEKPISIYFNINSNDRFKSWIHAMKRKLKKKFKSINKIDFDSVAVDIDNID
jgi:hypothetical protein